MIGTLSATAGTATTTATEGLATTQQVAAAIRASWDLSVPESQIQSALDRAIASGKLVRDRTTRVYSVSADVYDEIQTQIRAAMDLEAKVYSQWEVSVRQRLGDLPPEVMQSLWNCLQTYIAIVFHRHGVETARLINPRASTASDRNGSLGSYVQEAINTSQCGMPTELIEDVLQDFFANSTPERTKYTAQMLDLTFNFYALYIDRNMSDVLNSNFKQMTIFVDTNVIFGLLNLHTHHLSEVSKELLAVVKEHKLPFRLVYHPETLREINRSMHYAAERLCGKPWPQQLSRAAIASGVVSGIDLRFHELNSEMPINPEVFLSKYEHAAILLEEMGIREQGVKMSSEASDRQRHMLVEEYRLYVEARRPAKPKSQAVLNHDIEVWQAVQNLRGPSHTLLDAGAIFLSCDYLFYNFDWHRLNQGNRIGSVVIPSQLLQLLRSFVPSSADLDKKFSEALAVPEFRYMPVDYSSTPATVLSYLRIYETMREETAVKILSNEVLMGQLKNTEEMSTEFGNTIESAVVQLNQELLHQVDSLRHDRDELTRREDTNRQKVRDALARATQTEAALRREQESAEQIRLKSEETLRVEREAQAEKVRQLEAARDEAVSHDRLIQLSLVSAVLLIATLISTWMLPSNIGTMTSVVLLVWALCLVLIVIATLPSVFRWNWLLTHPHRYGLKGCVLAMAGALFAMYFWPDWIGTLASGILVGALLVVLQIIGGAASHKR